MLPIWAALHTRTDTSVVLKLILSVLLRRPKKPRTDTSVVLKPNTILRGITDGVKNFLLTKDSKLGQGARWLYSLEDSVFKGAVLAQKLKEGMSEADAIRYIADNYVDYTKPLPPAIRFLDNHGVTPFLGFAFRTASRAAQKSFSSDFSSDKLFYPHSFYSLPSFS